MPTGTSSLHPLAAQLEDDLQLLSDQLISNGPLPLSRVRVVAAAVCRKWLIDKNLAKLCQSLNTTPTFPALDTRPQVDLINKDGGFNFFTSGGISIDGRPLNSIYSHKDDNPSEKNRLPIPSERFYTISKLLSRKCTFIEGRWITSEDMMRYMANKDGGVHYDTTRDKLVDRKIDRAKEALWIGDTPPNPWPDGLEVFLQVSKPTGAPWNCTHIEMCSTAQSLLNLHLDGQRVVQTLSLPGAPTWRPLERFVGAIRRLI